MLTQDVHGVDNNVRHITKQTLTQAERAYKRDLRSVSDKDISPKDSFTRRGRALSALEGGKISPQRSMLPYTRNLEGRWKLWRKMWCVGFMTILSQYFHGQTMPDAPKCARTEAQ